MDALSQLDALYAEGRLSLRALRCCQKAQLCTVHDVARYHQSDPRYLTLSGCGKLTRRELNGLIKEAYGHLALRKSELETDANRHAAPSSWQARWQAAEEAQPPFEIAPDSVAAEWESEGTLTAADRRYARQCAEYAEFIIGSRGIPSSPSDIRLHQWYLKQRTAQSSLSDHREALFHELLLTLSERQ